MRGIRADRFTLAIGGKFLLDRVTFDLEPGLTHAVIGERAAGKTLLLRALVGMWPDEADLAGRLVVDGLEPAHPRCAPGARWPGAGASSSYPHPDGRPSTR